MASSFFSSDGGYRVSVNGYRIPGIGSVLFSVETVPHRGSVLFSVETVPHLGSTFFKGAIVPQIFFGGGERRANSRTRLSLKPFFPLWAWVVTRGGSLFARARAAGDAPVVPVLGARARRRASSPPHIQRPPFSDVSMDGLFFIPFV